MKTEAQLGVPITRIADGRTPWQVFYDVRFIGNSRVDLCSRVLKRDLARKWVDKKEPDAILVYGIDWKEECRIITIRERYPERIIEAPMMAPPFLKSKEIATWCRECGIEPPSLYQFGFRHNNCGGFCVKAGHKQFKMLLRVFPERYKMHEEEEKKMRKYLNKNVSILKDRRGGTTKPMTLKEFRERIESGEYVEEKNELVDCGCFI